MRSLAIVVLLALPLTGSVLAPMAPDRPSDAPLEATNAAALPARRDDAPCVPILAAERAAHYIALSWTECEGAERYLVHSGPSAAELVPLVEVNHASHNDLAPAWATVVYAVSTLDGPLSDSVGIALD